MKYKNKNKNKKKPKEKSEYGYSAHLKTPKFPMEWFFFTLIQFIHELLGAFDFFPRCEFASFDFSRIKILI